MLQHGPYHGAVESQVVISMRATLSQARTLQRWQVPCCCLLTVNPSAYADLARNSASPTVLGSFPLKPYDTCCKQVSDYSSHQQQPEAYQQHYSVPQYPGPPPQYDRRGSSGGGGLPTVVWVIVGAVIATVVSKIYGVVRSPGGIQGWVRTPYNHVLHTLSYYCCQECSACHM